MNINEQEIFHVLKKDSMIHVQTSLLCNMARYYNIVGDDDNYSNMMSKADSLLTRNEVFKEKDENGLYMCDKCDKCDIIFLWVYFDA